MRTRARRPNTYTACSSGERAIITSALYSECPGPNGYAARTRRSVSLSAIYLSDSCCRLVASARAFSAAARAAFWPLPARKEWVRCACRAVIAQAPHSMQSVSLFHAGIIVLCSYVHIQRQRFMEQTSTHLPQRMQVGFSTVLVSSSQKARRALVPFITGTTNRDGNAHHGAAHYNLGFLIKPPACSNTYSRGSPPDQIVFGCSIALPATVTTRSIGRPVRGPVYAVGGKAVEYGTARRRQTAGRHFQSVTV